MSVQAAAVTACSRWSFEVSLKSCNVRRPPSPLPETAHTAAAHTAHSFPGCSHAPLRRMLLAQQFFAQGAWLACGMASPGASV